MYFNFLLAFIWKKKKDLTSVRKAGCFKPQTCSPSSFQRTDLEMNHFYHAERVVNFVKGLKISHHHSHNHKRYASCARSSLEDKFMITRNMKGPEATVFNILQRTTRFLRASIVELHGF